MNRPMAFLSELASNASAKNVSIVFFSGNDDSLVQHRGTQGELLSFELCARCSWDVSVVIQVEIRNRLAWLLADSRTRI